ncbi:metal ABC transporter substrate-binding protein [Nocardioides mesophilus]|uniref:Zinc ABC transporter substrate-binding protein n=1 Tax=Nocardioides mesophilus TaxID=433659 RepID=A0A7G9RCJ4_9ACTN|nr:metal ABC transporter substrate-binding protein [Nocardioides mesophilus]QNN53319.1 zinc ABC transporter substrate-binding protein [Nocardioides mesophilus]
MNISRGLAVVASAVLVGGPVLAGCSAEADDGRTDVVASFYPLAYVAERVAGKHADVETLTRPGTEPHDLELTLHQIAGVAGADVVVYSRGLQAAVDDAVDQADPEHVVDADQQARPLVGDDPHWWLDPVAVAAVAAAVSDQLTQADPAHAADYAKNLEGFRADLEKLDRAYRQGLADCTRNTVVVSHDAFGALERYGLTTVAINGLSPDAEPSPAHLRELSGLIETKGITTVFSEALASPELAQTLADELGLATAVLDPIEGLSDQTADQDYLSLMRANLAALRKANDCR